MNTCGLLQILCVLLLIFQDAFCNEFDKKYSLSDANGEEQVFIGDFLKSIWRNSKHRRSVKSFRDGKMKTGVVEEALQTKPQSECGESLLTVVLKHADVLNIRVYGPLGDLLLLGQLAAFCGVSIKNTQTDVRLLFNYNSCYVKKEATKYVLSLSWYGTDVNLSCPVSVTPPSVVCKNNVMKLTVLGDGTADELSVALNGEWAPLLYVATRCWHRALSNQEELTFSFSHASCGVNLRDGRFTVDLRSKDKVMPLSCPYDPAPEYSVKDFGLSATDRVSHKPSTLPPSSVIASQIVKQDQMFSHEQQGKNATRTTSLHPRAHWLDKLSLPGSFNLAVNFPFSVPIPTPLVPIKDHLTSESVDSTPAPTPAPTSAPTSTPTPTPSDTQQLDINEPHVSYEKIEQDLHPVVTKSPQSQYQYMQNPYVFPKPAVTSSETELPSPQHQAPENSVPSTALYQPFGSAQNYNSPRPNPPPVHPALASLAQYLPPGYFICPYNNPQSPVVPQTFEPPIPNLVQPSQYQKPSYHKPDITQFAPANPAVPPMKGYSEQQMTSAIASSPNYPTTQLFQPTQNLQPSFFYQSSHGSQGSPTTPLSSPLIPINLQSQTRPYTSYPDTRLFQLQRYQKPSGSAQHHWSQESRLSSSQTPEYLQYQPSQLSEFPYPLLRPDVHSVDVSTENGPKAFFQPRSIAPAPNPKAHIFTGSRPFKSLPPLAPQLRPVKGSAQVVRLPYSQGPSIRNIQNPYVHSERPRSQELQNGTLPQFEFFRQASLAANTSPLFSSTSQGVQPKKKASRTGSYFFRPQVDVHN